MAQNESFYGTSRRAAAVAFLGVVFDALSFFSRHANYLEFLHNKISRAERDRDFQVAQIAAEGAEFTRRMKAAREAKRKADTTIQARA